MTTFAEQTYFDSSRKLLAICLLAEKKNLTSIVNALYEDLVDAKQKIATNKKEFTHEITATVIMDFFREQVQIIRSRYSEKPVISAEEFAKTVAAYSDLANTSSNYWHRNRAIILTHAVNAIAMELHKDYSNVAREILQNRVLEDARGTIKNTIASFHPTFEHTPRQGFFDRMTRGVFVSAPSSQYIDKSDQIRAELPLQFSYINMKFNPEACLTEWELEFKTQNDFGIKK